MNEPRLSVVVATYDRPELVLRCIDALIAQTLRSARFEIIVVDDGSSRDARERVMRALASRRRMLRAPTLRFLWLPSNRGPAVARNHGVLAARGRTIAFTDDDAVPHPDWLRAGLRGIANADAIVGSVVVPLPAVPTDYERDVASRAGARFSSVNCFVRRDLFEAVGGFDERFRCADRGDTDLCLRLRAAGAIVLRSRSARVMLPLRPARWGASLARQRRLMFDALLYKKFQDRYRRDVAARRPWLSYAAVAAGILALAYTLAGDYGVALAAFAAWLAIGLAFAWRRLAHTSHAASHVTEMIVTSLLMPWVSVYWRARGAWHFRVPFV